MTTQQPIMSSFKFHSPSDFSVAPDVYGGSALSSTTSFWQNDKCQGNDSNVQPSKIDNRNGSCMSVHQNYIFIQEFFLIFVSRFHKDVVDSCYKSRFWARILEIYLLDNDHQSLDTYRCPMENCTELRFVDYKQMLRHLKDCNCYEDGLFRCPICGKVEKFGTASSSKCLWDRADRPKFGRRLQNKIKATVGAVVRTTSPRIPRSPSKPTPENDKRPNDQTNPAFELQDNPVPELLGDSPLPNELDGSSESFSDEPRTYSSPSDLISSPEYQSGTFSAEVSPTSGTKSSTTPITNHAQQSYVTSTNVDQAFGSVSEVQIILGGVNYGEHTEASLQQPHSTLLYDAPPISSMIPVSSFNNQFTRGHPLPHLQIEYPVPLLDNPSYENMATFLDDATLDFMNNPEQQHLQHLVSSIPMEIQSPTTIEAPVRPLVAIQCDTQGWSVPSDSPSSSPNQPLNLEPDEGYNCQHCNYKPSGKSENYGAYFRKHQKVHERLQYRCENCDKLYTRPDNLEVHRRKSHATPNDGKRRRDDSSSPEPENQRKKRVHAVG